MKCGCQFARDVVPISEAVSGISRCERSGSSPHVAIWLNVPPGMDTAMMWLPSAKSVMCISSSRDSDTPPMAGSTVSTHAPRSWHLPCRMLTC